MPAPSHYLTRAPLRSLSPVFGRLEGTVDVGRATRNGVQTDCGARLRRDLYLLRSASFVVATALAATAVRLRKVGVAKQAARRGSASPVSGSSPALLRLCLRGGEGGRARAFRRGDGTAGFVAARVRTWVVERANGAAGYGRTSEWSSILCTVESGEDACGAAEQSDEADEAFAGTVASGGAGSCPRRPII